MCTMHTRASFGRSCRLSTWWWQLVTRARGWLISWYPDPSLFVAWGPVQTEVWKLPEFAGHRHYGPEPAGSNWWSDAVSRPTAKYFGLYFTVGKYYQKITIPIIRPILQNVAFPGCFSYILSIAIIFLTFFWLVCNWNMWLFSSQRVS